MVGLVEIGEARITPERSRYLQHRHEVEAAEEDAEGDGERGVLAVGHGDGLCAWVGHLSAPGLPHAPWGVSTHCQSHFRHRHHSISGPPAHGVIPSPRVVVSEGGRLVATGPPQHGHGSALIVGAAYSLTAPTTVARPGPARRGSGRRPRRARSGTVGIYTRARRQSTGRGGHRGRRRPCRSRTGTGRMRCRRRGAARPGGGPGRA